MSFKRADSGAITVLSSAQGGRVTLADRQVIMLGSNNYLGLANHPTVKAAVIDAVDRYGIGACINPCFVQTPIHAQLAEEVAAHLGAEDVVLYASCSAANAGVLATLATTGDVILSDQMNHASIIDGCRLSRARSVVYAYRDPQDLERGLAANKGEAATLVITDGVFSMEGHLAPLAALLGAAERVGAQLIVDDSHATGVVGRLGAGSASAAGLSGKRVITTGTFSKALGGAPGGFVAGSRAMTEILRSHSRSFIFTTGMSVADAAAALAALCLLRQSPEHHERLWANTQLFRQLLRGRGFAIEDSPSPITPLLVGDANRAKRIHARLLSLGVYVPVMAFPVVAHGDARLRAQPSAALTPEEVHHVADAIDSAFQERA